MAFTSLPAVDLSGPVTGTLATTYGGTSATSLPGATLPVWTKYTVTYTQLSAAALTNDIALLTLPAKTLIHHVVIKQTTAFAGTTTYTLSVGVSGTLAKYIAAYDVKPAVAATTFGASATNIQATLESFGGTTSVRVAATATVENLDQASAGVADIYVQTSTLP